MSPKASGDSTHICMLWIDYHLQTLNQIQAMPLRQRFAAKKEARMAWFEALIKHQQSSSALLAIAKECLTTTGLLGAAPSSYETPLPHRSASTTATRESSSSMRRSSRKEAAARR